MAAPIAALLPAPRPPADADAVSVLPMLFVPEACQWLSTTTGRVALEGYSWMQAVHWVAGYGLYVPRRHRSHGPRALGPTTVRVAQELAQLSPCRPGIEYLVRRTGLSERTVEYHLGMLREAGLLAYVVRGTRIRGAAAQASEFALMVPPEFDAALGIRTVLRDDTAPEYTRAPCGIAEAGRELMAKLARKASRKVRRPRRRTASKSSSKTASVKGARKGAEQGPVTGVAGEVRCTPMQVGTSAGFPAGGTYSPPEDKLASGEAQSPTPKRSTKQAGGRRKPNRVGRRYQLAKELVQELDWLRGCSVARIAWVARGVADAGWTVTEVQGWLHLRGEVARVRRGSGLLAVLLAGAETVLDTPARRAEAVEQWSGAQEAARRHRIEQVRARTERYDGDWTGPTSHRVQQEVAEAFAKVREVANGGRAAMAAEDEVLVSDSVTAHAESGVQGLRDEEIAQTRNDARQQLMMGDTSLITLAVDAMGREQAEQLYSPALVRRGLQLAHGARSSLMTFGRR
ncbi:helix-turn-helix domain-containing protein [Streptomyces arboris]|nr:helix-turn-helix domain-containing protein [Streptomyces arboris]